MQAELMPIRTQKDQMKLLWLQIRAMETTQLEGTSADASIGGAFDQLVCDKVVEMPQDSFLPSRRSNDESPEEVCDVEPAAAEDAASWEVA